MRTANHLARGKKVPKWKGFCLANGEPLPVAFPGKKGIFFSVFFVIKPTVISQLQWREMKKREEEEGEKRKKKPKKKREALCGT